MEKTRSFKEEFIEIVVYLQRNTPYGGVSYEDIEKRWKDMDENYFKEIMYEIDCILKHSNLNLKEKLLIIIGNISAEKSKVIDNFDCY